MTYYISARLMDVCMPDYLTDHCNGDDEALIGVAIGPQMFKWDQILAEAISEADQNEKIPADIDKAQLSAALQCASMRAATMVGNLLASGVWDALDDELDDGSGYTDSNSYAYFRLTWEEEDVVDQWRDFRRAKVQNDRRSLDQHPSQETA